jgi:hypothetical protein
MSAPELDNPFAKDSLQIVLDNFTCNLVVVNDLHRVAEDNVGRNSDLVGSMLIAMRRYLDDFDISVEQISNLVDAAEQHEKGGTE